MTYVVRQDLFQVGDIVRFDMSFYKNQRVPWEPVPGKEHTVLRVVRYKGEHLLNMMGHTQLLYITDSPFHYTNEFSGAWFERLR